VDFADKNLWVSGKDGSNPRELIDADILAVTPRWSPDGKHIAFLADTPPLWRNTQLYLVASDGGEPELLVEGARPWSLSWSQDGRRIAFDNNIKERIEIFDLKSQETQAIPGSEKAHFPQWSPDGQYLVALKNSQLLLFELEESRWSTLAEEANYPQWSRQGRPWVYFISHTGVYRVHATDRQIEKITEVGFELAGGYDFNAIWIGLTPDDAVLTLQRRSFQDIYALDLEAP
jgi:Tol biopolymer transport system component